MVDIFLISYELHMNFILKMKTEYFSARIVYPFRRYLIIHRNWLGEVWPVGAG